MWLHGALGDWEDLVSGVFNGCATRLRCQCLGLGVWGPETLNQTVLGFVFRVRALKDAQIHNSLQGQFQVGSYQVGTPM